MATSGRRDVELGISVSTAGAESIRRLQDEVRALGKEGGAAAPEFERLAQEIGELAARADALAALEKVAQDVNSLATAEGRASSATRDLLGELAEAATRTAALSETQKALAVQLAAAQREAGANRDALATFKNEATAADRSTAAYSERVRDLTRATIDSRAEVRQLGAAYKEARSATGEAASAEADLQREFNQSAAAAQRIQAALTKRNQALRDARTEAEAAGAATTDLAGSTNALAVAVASAEREARRLVEAERQQAAAAKAAALEEDRLAAIVANSKREMAAAAQQQLAVERQVYAEMEAEQRRAAQAAREAGQAIDTALRTVGVRAADAIRGEIAQVRTAMDLLRSSGTLAGAELDRAMRQGENRIKSLEADLRRATGQLTLMDRAAAGMRSTFAQFAGAFTVVELVQRIGRAFFDANKQVEGLRLGLGAIYKNTATAAAQIDFLRATASRAGVSIGSISESFVRFSASLEAAGIPLQQANALFAAITQSAGTLGLSGDKVSHMLDALSQMAGKGVVSMEELRQQLGDSLPGAMALVAKGLGVTQQKLFELVESGGLLARDLFPALTRSLQSMSGEVNTLSASWERFKNAFTVAAQVMGDSGFTDILKAGLVGVAVVLKPLVLGFSTLTTAIFAAARAVGAFAGAVATGNFKLLGDDLRKIVDDAIEGQTKLNAAFDAVTKSTDASTVASGAAAAAATTNGQAQQAAAASVQANATAHAVGAQAATSNASAQASAGTAAATAGAQASAAAGTWTGLSIRYGEVSKEAEKTVLVKEKLARATLEAGTAAVELGRLTGNERVALSEAALAAANNARALDDVSKARRDSVATLESLLAGLQREAQLLGDPDGSRAKYIKEIAQTVALRKAEAEQAASAAAAAKVDVEEKTLARQAYEDNTKSLALLRQAMEDTRQSAILAAMQERDGYQTKEQVTAANLRAARAEGLYNDALQDSVRAAERANVAIGNRNRVIQAGLDVELQQARNSEARAQALGNETLATEAAVRQKEIQIRVVQANAEAMRQEAAQTIANAEAIRKELTELGTLTPEKDAEIQSRLDNAKAKEIEANGSKGVVEGIRLEIDALRRRQQQLQLTGGGGGGAGGRGGPGGSGRNADGSYRNNADSLGVIGPNQDVKSRYGATAEDRLAGQNATDNRLMFELRDKLTAGTLSQNDIGALKTVVASIRQNGQVNADVMRRNPGAISLEGARDDRAWYATMVKFEDAIKRLEKPVTTKHVAEFKFPDGSTEQFGMASEEDAARLAKGMTNLQRRIKR